MVTILKTVFGTLCDGSQSLLGINNTDSQERQRRALVGMGMAHSLSKCGALDSHTPTQVSSSPSQS